MQIKQKQINCVVTEKHIIILKKENVMHWKWKKPPERQMFLVGRVLIKYLYILSTVVSDNMGVLYFITFEHMLLTVLQCIMSWLAG